MPSVPRNFASALLVLCTGLLLNWPGSTAKGETWSTLDGLAGHPILSLMIRSADAIAHVKATVARDEGREGGGVRRSLMVIQPFKGSLHRNQVLLELDPLETAERESGTRSRLPVNDGREYIVFLKRIASEPQPAFRLLDDWTGVLPHHRRLGVLVRRTVDDVGGH